MSQDRIKEILARYGEPMEGNCWRVQGQAVILHKALERIAARAGIVFDPPVVLRAEREEAVLLVTGRLNLPGELPPDAEPGRFYAVETGERAEWSIGEALVNVNYRVSGKQAGYVYAMAEKRAKDRVILKLLELHGYAYSEDEADDFKDGKPRLVEPEPDPEPALLDLGAITVNGEQVLSSYAARKEDLWTPLVNGLRACERVEDMLEWKQVNAEVIGKLPPLWRDALREEWTKHVDEIRGGDHGEA